jgi:hypothetical protein
MPGPAQPNYGAAPQPPVPSQPVYAPPVYQQPQYPYPVQSTGMSTGAKVGLGVGLGCLGLIVIPIVIIALIGATTTTSSGYEPWDPTSQPEDDTGTGNGNTVGSVEAQWKSGADWLTPPAGETAPSPFMADFSTPEQYLNYAMGEYAIEVVFTDDPTYNCGFSKATAQPDWVIGCYNPDYGETIFLWWGPEAADDMKALILLHEYSHYYQNYYYFDATRSAADADLFDDPTFVQEVWETDATCRVYDDWHYTNLEYLDSYTVSPCGDTGWGPHWFENELLERGVQVTDY